MYQSQINLVGALTNHFWTPDSTAGIFAATGARQGIELTSRFLGPQKLIWLVKDVWPPRFTTRNNLSYVNMKKQIYIYWSYFGFTWWKHICEKYNVWIHMVSHQFWSLAKPFWGPSILLAGPTTGPAPEPMDPLGPASGTQRAMADHFKKSGFDTQLTNIKYYIPTTLKVEKGWG